MVDGGGGRHRKTNAITDAQSETCPMSKERSIEIVFYGLWHNRSVRQISIRKRRQLSVSYFTLMQYDKVQVMPFIKETIFTKILISGI